MEKYLKYLKGVNGQLSYEELDSICQTEVPDGEYYDYEKIRAVILRKLNGELDDEYFRTWLIVVSWAIQKDSEDLSWAFDGYSFCDSFSKNDIVSILSVLKEEDYKMRYEDYIEQHKKEQLNVVYLRFEHANWTEDSAIYKAYFVDYKNKRFDIRLIDSAFYEFKKDVFYCTLFDKDEREGEEDYVEPKELPEEEQLLHYFYDENEEWTYDHTLDF